MKSVALIVLIGIGLGVAFLLYQDGKRYKELSPSARRRNGYKALLGFVVLSLLFMLVSQGHAP
jgi:hypothetical protein